METGGAGSDSLRATRSRRRVWDTATPRPGGGGSPASSTRSLPSSPPPCSTSCSCASLALDLAAASSFSRAATRSCRSFTRSSKSCAQKLASRASASALRISCMTQQEYRMCQPIAPRQPQPDGERCSSQWVQFQRAGSCLDCWQPVASTFDNSTPAPNPTFSLAPFEPTLPNLPILISTDVLPCPYDAPDLSELACSPSLQLHAPSPMWQLCPARPSAFPWQLWRPQLPPQAAPEGRSALPAGPRPPAAALPPAPCPQRHPGRGRADYSLTHRQRGQKHRANGGRGTCGGLTG